MGEQNPRMVGSSLAWRMGEKDPRSEVARKMIQSSAGPGDDKFSL